MNPRSRVRRNAGQAVAVAACALLLDMAVAAAAAVAVDGPPPAGSDAAFVPQVDPFASVAQATAARGVAAPQVQAVLLAGGRALARVDQTLVAVGESVSGWRVSAIDEHGVRFERDGQRVRRAVAGLPDE